MNYYYNGIFKKQTPRRFSLLPTNKLFDEALTKSIDFLINSYSDDDLPEWLTTDIQIVEFAGIELAKREYKKYYKENYGKRIDIDICGCTVWTVGNETCECGKVHLDIDIIGNILDGFEVETVKLNKHIDDDYDYDYAY